MTDLPWLVLARSYIGQKEIPGKDENPLIVRWIIEAASWLPRTEGTAWCGAFVSHCLTHAGMRKPVAGYRARAYLDYGHDLTWPAYGSIVVLERGGAGHVGFLVGMTYTGRPMILGGNQRDSVSIAPFEPGRVLAYRWPPTNAYQPTIPLPKMAVSEASSEGEA